MTSAWLHDTLTGEAKSLPSPGEGPITLYVCGPTVYDRLHLGNFRTFVVFDVLRRLLAAQGYVVRHAVNITDVDDKMIRKAADDGVSVSELASRYIRQYRTDREALGILPPHEEPRATDYVPAMVVDIARLIEAGKAYALPNGDVFFRTRRSPGYGALSGQDLSALQTGSRVEADPRKENPLDFAVWKAEKPGEPSWQSPWGRGRPGWHMECTTMLRSLFGGHVSFHGGGQDLIFPHHENERAQTNALGFAREAVGTWLHCGLLLTEGEKMSKSLGNTLSVEALTRRFSPMALRVFLLSTHYRKPQTLSEQGLSAAEQGSDRLMSCLTGLEERWQESPHLSVTEADRELGRVLAQTRDQMMAALVSDLNAAQAMGHLFEATRQVNGLLRGDLTRTGLAKAKDAYLGLWGLLGLEPTAHRIRAQLAEETSDPEVVALVMKREKARQERDFTAADEIRTQLGEMGVLVQDTPNGPRWQRRTEEE